MQITDACVSLVRNFEGLRTTAYRCPAGVWTIGYGHTEGVKEGDVITEARAAELLTSELQSFAADLSAVLENAGVAVSQNEFDALTSFTYNVGMGNFLTSTLFKRLKAGDHAAAASELLKWNRAGGKVLDGLKRRREAERRLFITPDVPPDAE